MIFALLAFMVCALVAVLIVSSALTSVKRAEDDKKLQQSRITLNSAAELVKGEMMASSISYTEEIEIDGSKQTEKVTDVRNGSFGDYLSEAIASIKSTGFDYTKDITISVKEADKDIMTPVNCHLVFKKNDTLDGYRIICTFSTESGSDTVYLTMTTKTTVSGPTSKTVKKNGNKQITVITTVTTYEWNEGIIDMKGDK